MEIPVYVSDRLYIPIVPGQNEIVSAIKEGFRHKNPKYQQTKKMGFWAGGIPPYIDNWMMVNHQEFGNCISIPRGGTNRLRKYASAYDINLSFVDHRLVLEPIHLKCTVDLWPEQQKLARAMLAHENCLIRSPTASGKTITSLKVIETMLAQAGPVLVIVWEGSRKSGLMKQWFDNIQRFFDLDADQIGIIGDGIKKLGPITIGMQQTLNNCGHQFTHSFGGVLCDEVQRFAAATFRKVVDIFPARYRFGISADESRHDRMEYLVYDEFGEVAEEIKKITLVAKERIHEVQVRVIPTDFNYHVVFTQLGATEQVQWVDLPSDDKNYIDMITRMITDEDRNDLAWEFLEPCLRAGHTIMIATERVSHAKYWNDRIRDAGYASGLMLGGAAYAEQFEVTSNALRAGKILAGVGTIQKISTGHDIPRWNRGFVMTPLVKNRQKLEQLFGRLRRTHESKTDVVVYYMWDRKIYPSHKSRLVNLYKGHVQTFTEGDFL